MKNNEEEYTKEFENIFHRHFNADKMLPEGFLTRTRGRIPDEYKKILSPFLRKEVQFSTKLVLDDEGCERKYPYFTITYRGIQQKFIAMYFTYERKFKYELWANIFKVKTEEDQIDFSKQLLKTKRFYCYLHKDAPLNAEDMQLYFKYDFKWREKSILKKMISESEYEAFQRISTELREDGNILNYGVVENEFVKFSMEGKINFDPETGKIVGFGKITINEKHITELVLGGFFGSYNSLHNTEFGMIEGVKINHIPESLGRLTHLRQLDLSYNSITKLPTSFG
ncbi:MAG: hypothetical protein KAT16_08360, partial [Candidatus Heimdallarchaeota archaeon]|nr:hypothetical protein [Candidatus Heimdallarchaeota archaeon]